LAIVVILVLAAVLKVLLVMEPITLQAEIDRVLPRRAVEYVRENPPQGNMLNAYNWGGYLMYALPEYPVFVDGRTDLYGDQFLADYLRAARGGDNWRDMVDQYAIGWVLVETGSGLANNLLNEPGWRLAYSDDQASLYVKDA